MATTGHGLREEEHPSTEDLEPPPPCGLALLQVKAGLWPSSRKGPLAQLPHSLAIHLVLGEGIYNPKVTTWAHCIISSDPQPVLPKKQTKNTFSKCQFDIKSTLGIPNLCAGMGPCSSSPLSLSPPPPPLGALPLAAPTRLLSLHVQNLSRRLNSETVLEAPR